jgi:hypothetical protein
MNFLILHLTTVLLLAPLVEASPTRQFDLFFPTWNPMLQDIIHGKCLDEYNHYKNDTGAPIVGSLELVTPLIDCVLGQLPETRKAEMGASTVLLGAMPTMLQALGSTTAETSLLSLHRPFLSLLLSIGSPAVVTMGDTDVANLLTSLSSSPTRPLRRFSQMQRGGTQSLAASIICLGQYAGAGVAAAIVAVMAYQLSVHAITVCAPEIIYLLPLWTVIAVVIHALSVLALRLRIPVREHWRKAQGPEGSSVGMLIQNEFTLSCFQKVNVTGITPNPDVPWTFYVMSWLLNIVSVMHVVFGTVIMSSLLFFSVADSVLILGLYMTSALICRCVVHFELAGMKEVAASGGQYSEVNEYEMYNKNDVNVVTTVKSSRAGAGW